MTGFFEDQMNRILLDGLYESRSPSELATDLGEAFQSQIWYLTLEEYLSSVSEQGYDAPLGDVLSVVHNSVLNMMHNEDFSVHEIISSDQESTFFKVVAEGRIPFALIILSQHAGMSSADAHVIIEGLSRVSCFLSRENADRSLSDNTLKAGLSRLLLDGKKHSDTFYSAIQNIYQGYQYHLESYYAIAVIRPANSRNFGALVDAMNTMSELFGKSYRQLDNDLLSVLFCDLSCKSNWSAWDAFREKLSRFVQEQHAVCAVSLPFDSLELCSDYKRQAMDALLLFSGRRENVGVFFAEDSLSDVLIYGALKKMDLETFILSDVRIMEEYDRENGSKMLVTLETYLNNRGRSSNAAKALFIDRSTLKYRLDRISDILNLDLSDRAALARMKMAIQIYRVKEFEAQTGSLS